MPILARLTRRSRFTRAAALVAVVAGGTAGCGGDDTGTATEPNAAVVGSYTIVAHDGRPLPAVVATWPNGNRTELLGGTLDLGADRGFALRRNFRETNAQGQQTVTSTESVTGGYTVRGRVVVFDGVGDPVLDAAEATVSGTTLTYGPLTFRR